MPLASGTRLGPYEIAAPLGAGGMGEVYRARDVRLARDVAVKVLPPRLAGDPMALDRFRREAQLLAGLSHPHIAAVYGFEEGALAMELVAGETLADRLRRGALPVEEALGIARQLAEALEYAHERGIIHRDLKPANIKISPDDQVKVLDFGLAKALDADRAGAEPGEAETLSSPATLPGTIVGTAAYMAPEQARGKAVDRRADIWAFGAVWYEMLTGQRAFEGDTTSDVLASVLRAEPDWGRLPQALPPQQRRLLLRCLRKDPRQRQQSMGDLRLALEEAPAEAAPVAAPLALGGRWPLASGLGMGGVVLGVLGAWLLWTGAPPPAATSFRAITSFAGVQMQPALSPDGRSVAFVSNQDGAFNVYISLIGGGSLLQITHGAEVKSHPTWSPNGNLLVYAQLNVSGLSDVWEVPALGGTPRRLLRDAADPAWSPDGQWLAFAKPSTGALWMSAPSGENARQLAPRLLSYDGDPRFSPDGKQVAFFADTPGPYGQLEVLDLATGGLRQLSDHNAIGLSPAWSPDGRTLFFASGRSGTINIWKIPARGGVAAQVTTGQGDDAELDLSSDGRHLAFATFRTDSHIAQLDLHAPKGTLAVREITTDPARHQTAPQYSPDGTRLAYFTNLKGVELEQVWTSAADGSGAAPLISDKLSNVFPRWSPDGRTLYFTTDFHGGVTHDTRSVAADGGSATTALAQQDDIHFDVGPGDRLAFVAANGDIESYDPNLRQRRRLFAGRPDLRPMRVRWSPDGVAVAFSVGAQRDDDPAEGLWILGLKGGKPQQVFHGWVRDFERGPQGLIYIRAGSPDLKDPFWTVGWDGRGLQRLGLVLPEAHDYWGTAGRGLFALSPDGRYLAFTEDDDLQADIGMLAFGK